MDIKGDTLKDIFLNTPDRGKLLRIIHYMHLQKLTCKLYAFSHKRLNLIAGWLNQGLMVTQDPYHGVSLRQDNL